MADLKRMYKEIVRDSFPDDLEISLGRGEARQTLRYRKVTWNLDGQQLGLRYGENPDQPAAFYALSEGGVTLDDLQFVGPGDALTPTAELLQFGKHPSKINLTDIDNALNILRYLDKPACAVMKHNNPSGVAQAGNIADAYEKAYLAEPVAAFGGAVVLNRPVTADCAEAIARQYAEVVCAPDYEEGTVATLAQRKNLRIVKLPRIAELARWRDLRFLDFKSLIDGGLVVQTSFVPLPRGADDLIPAYATEKGREVRIARAPTPAEVDDLLFGWFVEAGVSSNSVIYVKDGVTVGIGTGEQDRVGVAEIARDKAYRAFRDRMSYARVGKAFRDVTDAELGAQIEDAARQAHGGLKGACMVSDGFFPFPDGLEVGLREGITAVIQPGGSLNDAAVIDCANRYGAAMVFTGQRSFKH